PLAALLSQRIRIVSAVFAYLSDEFRNLLEANLPEDVLRGLYRDLLDVSQRASQLVAAANRVTNARAEQTLDAIARGGGDGTQEAYVALVALRLRPADALFPADVLVPVATRLRGRGLGTGVEGPRAPSRAAD